MDGMKEKIGGLPVWAWGAIIGLIVVFWMWTRNRSSATTNEFKTPVSDLTGWRDTNGVPISSLYGNTSSYATETYGATNQSWQTQGINFASTLGYTFLDVQTALMNYLRGDTLTTTQQNIVNAVLEKIGPPPDGLSSTPNITSNASQVFVQSFIRKPLTEVSQSDAEYGQVWAVMSDGSLWKIDRGMWTAAGSPKFEDVRGNDPIWNREKIMPGTDSWGVKIAQGPELWGGRPGNPLGAPSYSSPGGGVY